MSNFEQIENIIEEIDQYVPGVDSDADDKFYAQFAFPKTLDRFIALVECLVAKHKEESVKRDRLTLILTDCVYSDNSLPTLLYSTVAFSDKNAANQNPLLLSKLVNILVSLPELISNLYGFNCPPKFMLKTYIVRLCIVLRKVLMQIHANLDSFKLSHIYLIVGRLCLKGHSQVIWDNLLRNISSDLVADLKWLKIARKILLNDSTQSETTPDQFMLIEPIFKMIFANSPCYQSVNKLLNYEYLQSINGKGNLLNKIEFLLTNKFLLIFNCGPSSRSQNIDPFLFNISTYLYTNNRQWLLTAIDNVLNTWANSNGFKHRSYYQHFYLARQIIIFTKLLFQYNPDETSKEILPKFRKVITFSAEIHLKSTQMEFRVIGLTATVIVMDLLAKYSKIDLELPKFEEVESSINEDCLFLKKLAVINIKDIFDAISNDKCQISENKDTHESLSQNQEQIDHSVPDKTERNVQLDSDDDEDDNDLQPYDLSNDIQVEDDVRYVGKEIEPTKRNQTENIQDSLLIDNSRQAPIYLQDCIDGLVQIEKPFWAEKCLLSAEKIIRANFSDSSDKSSSQNSMEYGRLNTVALKFAQILFNLDNQVAIDNFEKLRLNALIALCVGAPKIVAKYLSEQFYAPYLPIRNRLDVLNVLTFASEELSKPVQLSQINSVLAKDSLLNEPSKRAIQFQQKYFGITYSGEDQDSDDDGNEDTNKWQSIVSERIRSNTRFISPQYSKRNFELSSSAVSTSRFVPVSGYFFFPLLRDPNKTEIQLNLHEEDSYVLEQLFYSLGLLLQKCANYSQVNLMAKELLKFMSSFRNHQLKNVRLSMIMVFQAILKSTPTFYLFDDLMTPVVEFQLWLKEIVLNDLDQNCTQTAMLTLNILSKLAKSTGDINLNPIESKSSVVSKESTISERTFQSVSTLDLNSAIRAIKQTSL